MKRNTIILSILAVLGGIGILAGCKKSYLAETPYSSYSPATLTDSLGFEAAVDGLGIGDEFALHTLAEGVTVALLNGSVLGV